MEKVKSIIRLIHIFVMFSLSGCYSHYSYMHSADVMVKNERICVFINGGQLIKNENIARVNVMEYGKPEYLLNDETHLGKVLQADWCLSEFNNYDFSVGRSYSVTVETKNNIYRARFIVWKYGEKLMVTDRY